MPEKKYEITVSARTAFVPDQSDVNGARYVFAYTITITNTGTTPDRLVSAKSAAAGAVQVHEMKMEGNVMRMREVDGGLAIAPGATVTLAPGGLHIMLMGLKAPLRQGEKVPLTLVFEKAGSIDVELAVMPLGASPPSGHGSHQHK